ncbi:polymeric immunoglobulin receptor-like [Sardina pilchardus]|uniref:polymeric immunoglobulin receptor-like n=1 Tax=Sardina pilchardus TaxID=27697 RepID=UPI002E0EBB1C
MNLSVSTIFLITVGWCEAVTMTGYLGGRANIYCRYPSHTSRDYKSIYKQTTVDRSDCVASTDPGIVNQDRFSINDDTLRRVATVTISSVSVGDSGEYQCQGYTLNGVPVIFERVKFWAIPLTGYIGGEVQMKCPYESKFEKNTKYLQKLGSPISLVQTEDGQIRADNGRFSLYDDTEGRELMVNVRGLQAEDSGKYRCGIKDFSHREWPLAVKNVISVSGFEGHTIDISCKYQNMSGAYRKHFCQGTDPKKCLEEGLLTQDRVCLRDNAADQVFTVAMSNFKAEDAGIYWCVAIDDISQVLEFTSAVQLTVKNVLWC